MPPTDFFQKDPEDSRESIMRATYYALQEYGYADLTLQRIADRSDLHKSTLYHHFDTKEDLLDAFLDYLLELNEKSMAMHISDQPVVQLNDILDKSFSGTASKNETRGLQTALFIELRNIAVHNEKFRKRYTEIDRVLSDHIAKIIQKGIEKGEFNDMDPQRTAQIILTLCLGGIFRRETNAEPIVPSSHQDLDDFLTLIKD